MGLGNTIKTHLEEQGRSVVWLSKQTNINQNSLYAMFKRDSNNISEDNLLLIGEALNVSAAKLVAEARKEALADKNNKLADYLLRKFYKVVELVAELGKYAVHGTKEEMASWLFEITSMAETISSIQYIGVDDLTSDEVAELVRYKEYLIWRRDNGKE